MKSILEWGNVKRVKISKEGVEKGNLSLNLVALLGIVFFKIFAFFAIIAYALGYRYHVGENTKDMYKYVSERKRDENDAN